MVNYTDVSFIVKEGFGFEDGLFNGYDAEKRSYPDKSTWSYELDEDGFARVDKSLTHPRCVFNLLKQHYSRYTPEVVSNICGTPQDKMLQVWETIAETSAPGKVMTIMYALGWTQHSTGSQMIRTGAMVQLLLGNIGMPGGGMNALRGHSNIQGLTDLGLLSNQLPGYMTLPLEAEQDYAAYIAKRTAKPLRPGQLSYWQHYEKFHVSLMKAWYGKNATAENNWGYDWLPKLDIPGYDVLKVFDMMYQGRSTAISARASTPSPVPQQGQGQRRWPSLAPGGHGPAGHRDLGVLAQRRRIQRRRHRQHPDHGVPPADHLFCRGGWFAGQQRALAAVALEGRRAARPGEDRRGDHGRAVPSPARALQQGRRCLCRTAAEHRLAYRQPEEPTAEEIAQEYNGKALADVFDLQTGAQLARPASCCRASACCAPTAPPRVAAGSSAAPDPGRQPDGPSRQRRPGMGQTLGWAWAWPANRRILYNRASADPAGNPWDAQKKRLVWWDGGKWAVPTCRTSRSIHVRKMA